MNSTDPKATLVRFILVLVLVAAAAAALLWGVPTYRVWQREMVRSRGTCAGGMEQKNHCSCGAGAARGRTP